MTDLAPLFEAATLFVQAAETGLLAAYPVLLRVGAAMALLPALGEASVPMRVRAALTLALTAAAYPAVSVPPDMALPRLFLTETAVGLALGFVFRLFVLALQTAGTIMAQAVSLSQLFPIAGAEPSPVLSNLLVMAGLAFFVLSGLHVEAVRLIVLSYTLFPPGVLPGAGAFAEWGVAQVAQSFALAMALAMPFLAVSLLFNIALGAINRAMPQLMVVFVGAPAITLLGIGLLAVGVPLILVHWGQAVQLMLADPFGLPR